MILKYAINIIVRIIENVKCFHKIGLSLMDTL